MKLYFVFCFGSSESMYFSLLCAVLIGGEGWGMGGLALSVTTLSGCQTDSSARHDKRKYKPLFTFHSSVIFTVASLWVF